MGRKPMLLKKMSASNGYEGKRTVGLIGTNRGVGVTYTGMLLAYYFSLEKVGKIAYLECNMHLDFDRLQEAYEWTREDEQSFSLDRISYYKQVSKKQIAHILNSDDFDYFILDFGTDYINSMEELIRCTDKVIIGGSAIWNQSKILEFLKTIEDISGGRGWKNMIPYADRRTVKGLAHETKRIFYSIPYEPDPSSLSRESYRLFYKLFG